MNKAELIKAVAEHSRHSQAQTTVIVNSLIGIIQETLAKGEGIQLIGFGSFTVTDRASREGRNPTTGETIVLPAKKAVKFKPGKSLAESVAQHSAAS